MVQTALCLICSHLSRHNPQFQGNYIQATPDGELVWGFSDREFPMNPFMGLVECLSRSSQSNIILHTLSIKVYNGMGNMQPLSRHMHTMFWNLLDWSTTVGSCYWLRAHCVSGSHVQRSRHVHKHPIEKVIKLNCIGLVYNNRLQLYLHPESSQSWSVG